MDNSPLVSIIMPVYGVEKYVAKAIESILNQTFFDYELIVVDDCSIDKSMEIVHQYAVNNEKVKVIRTPQNSGLGRARNFGLKSAMGKYVLFVDSDDSLDKYAVEELYNAAHENNAQLVICGFYEVHCDSDGTIKGNVLVCPERNIFRGKDEIHRRVPYLDMSTVGRYAWNKLYQTQFLLDNKIEFEKIEPIEDICFNLKVYDNAETMVTIDKPLYLYFKRSNVKTLSNTYNDKLFDLFKERYIRISEYYEKWGIAGNESIQINYIIYLRHIITLMQRISMASGFNSHDKKEKIERILSDDITSRCMNDMKSSSIYNDIFRTLIKANAVSTLMILSKLVYWIKIVFPKYYGKLRSKG